MYLVYVDESGDIGLNNSPTSYFVLSGLVVHESAWHELLNETVQFRRSLKKTYGLKLREEIHAAEFFASQSGQYKRIEKHNRLQICKKTIDFQEKLDFIKLVNVVVDKHPKHDLYNVFEEAWKVFIQRIENTIQHQNFPRAISNKEKAIIISDRTDDKRLKNLSRRMRKYNPIPNASRNGYRHLETISIIEDPVPKDSGDSFFHQLVDVNAYFLHQSFAPKKYIKKKKGNNFFNRYDSVLCKVASRSNPKGIVML